MALIRVLQTEITNWVRTNFSNNSDLATYMGTLEELLEAGSRLARVITKSAQGSRGFHDVDYAQRELEKECADVFIKLCDIAQYTGFSLEEAIVQRWETVQARSRTSTTNNDDDRRVDANN